MKHEKLFCPSRLATILMILFVCSCADPYPFLYETNPAVKDLVVANAPEYPDMTFAVLSDPHYFSPDLLVEPSSAFEDYLDTDRKMLKEGPEILDAALAEIVANPDVDFVIIPGDLTKDGEEESHLDFAEEIQILQAAGKGVYVIQGYHDIKNGDSLRYDGAYAIRVAHITPERLEEIYWDYGYSTAGHKDPHSRSFIVEPVAGLWLFGLDACLYAENQEDHHPVTDGAFSPETLVWIELKLIEAIMNNKAVIGFMHHGVLEHYGSNEEHYGDYLLDDFEYISEMLAAYGMRYVFTGHYHAQDITAKRWQGTGIGNHFLYDIETGSLATYPVPWRLVQISGLDQEMGISSHRVESIDSHPADFQVFAEDFVRQGTALLADEALQGYGVPEEDRILLNPQIVQAYVTHLQGDEVAPVPVIDFDGLSLIGRVVAVNQSSLIEGWYKDIVPGDNDIVIDMVTGQVP